MTVEEFHQHHVKRWPKTIRRLWQEEVERGLTEEEKDLLDKLK